MHGVWDVKREIGMLPRLSNYQMYVRSTITLSDNSILSTDKYNSGNRGL